MSELNIVVELLTSDKDDLKSLATIAGADYRTFYRGANFRKSDLTHENLLEFDLDHSNTEHCKLTAQQRGYLKGRGRDFLISLDLKALTKDMALNYGIEELKQRIAVLSTIRKGLKLQQLDIHSEIKKGILLTFGRENIEASASIIHHSLGDGYDVITEQRVASCDSRTALHNILISLINNAYMITIEDETG